MHRNLCEIFVRNVNSSCPLGIHTNFHLRKTGTIYNPYAVCTIEAYQAGFKAGFFNRLTSPEVKYT